MESKIRDLQCKNNTMELELAKVKEEDNSSKSYIIEAKIKEIYEGQLKQIDEEIENIRETQKSNNNKI